MLNAIRCSARGNHPYLFSSSLPNNITRIPSTIRFAQAPPGPNQPDSSDDMNPKKDPESETGDTMSSLGEAYATRSDEEGFGGIYGGNKNVSEDNEEKNAHRNAPEFDRTQGSEVKKEKARNQTKAEPHKKGS